MLTSSTVTPFVQELKLKKVKLPMVNIVAGTDYTPLRSPSKRRYINLHIHSYSFIRCPGGAYLRFCGLEPAVGLHPALWMVDHTSSTTCRYLPGFYTGTKLYCLVTDRGT